MDGRPVGDVAALAEKIRDRYVAWAQLDRPPPDADPPHGLAASTRSHTCASQAQEACLVSCSPVVPPPARLSRRLRRIRVLTGDAARSSSRTRVTPGEGGEEWEKGGDDVAGGPRATVSQSHMAATGNWKAGGIESHG